MYNYNYLSCTFHQRSQGPSCSRTPYPLHFTGNLPAPHAGSEEPSAGPCEPGACLSSKSNRRLRERGLPEEAGVLRQPLGKACDRPALSAPGDPTHSQGAHQEVPGGSERSASPSLGHRPGAPHVSRRLSDPAGQALRAGGLAAQGRPGVTPSRASDPDRARAQPGLHCSSLAATRSPRILREPGVTPAAAPEPFPPVPLPGSRRPSGKAQPRSPAYPQQVGHRFRTTCPRPRPRRGPALPPSRPPIPARFGGPASPRPRPAH
ncbi:translation initiation factor IF-2-like [Lemur catta]|uniref:translation initiation factor IF-2-like n=1 Tax=Lemur catta TaxID=9447 RepID=UPI001E26E2C7|nr:translation initiation factor IF-2-like [Lemur catta]